MFCVKWFIGCVGWCGINESVRICVCGWVFRFMFGWFCGWWVVVVRVSVWNVSWVGVIVVVWEIG